MNIEIKEYRKERTVYLSDEIDSITVNDVQRAIQEIIEDDVFIFRQNTEAISKLGSNFGKTYISNNTFPTINLYINSLGGSVYDGIGLYDYIRNINENTKHKISIICTGVVASMATIVILAAGDRVATKNTSFLIHSMFDLMSGKIQDIEDGLAECKRLNKIMNDIYLENTNLTAEKLAEIDKSKKDWWFGAEKAVELGLIKGII